MAGYQRFVAYVYEYRKGKKGWQQWLCESGGHGPEVSDGGSSALCWAGTGKPVQGVWLCAAGRVDGRNSDRELCYRAGADRVYA